MPADRDPPRLAHRRICYIDAPELPAQAPVAGCDGILLAPSRLSRTGRGGADPARAGERESAAALKRAARACADKGAALLLDLVLADLAGAGPGPERLQSGLEAQASPGHIEACARRLLLWAEAGVAGVRCCRPLEIAAPQWQRLIASVHASRPDFSFLAWTPGLAPSQLAALEPAGFAATFLSLPWWDGRAPWLLDEYARLSRVAPVIAPVDDPHAMAGIVSAPPVQPASRLWMAAFFGDGLLLTARSARQAGPETCAAVGRWLDRRTDAPASGAGMHSLAGPLSPVSAFARRNGADASVLVFNPDHESGAAVDWGMLASRLPDDDVFQDDAHAALPAMLPPGGLAVARLAQAERTGSPPSGLDGPEIAIENIRPAVDGGLFAAKACVGDRVRVRAAIFTHGHERLAASLSWRPARNAPWQNTPMREIGNDEWEACFQPRSLGLHSYMVSAWRDEWTSFCEHLRKKRQAAQDIALEIEEGRQTMRRASDRILSSDADAAGRIRAFAQAARNGGEQAADVLLSDEAAHAMRAADHRPCETLSAVYPLTVDRRRARHANWYELFPRSQGKEAGSHGTLRDVIGQLPEIAAMGFDVLYFPPIHPIGMTNRKGRNNALEAAPGDPGSPYAIGSSAGGHDAIHPELGDLDDFRDLVLAAHAHGMEIALDFAIQCSPDHPWLKQHPDWFAWRADGSLRFAENPPKRYEDIVNPEFYDADGRPRRDLWKALLDIVLFWAERGVSTFRVDNPHTKPLPFWQWMIAEVRARHPQAIFLSEAFTRPGMMYRLAKAGFSQSYTYFTWRNSKQELTEYLTELNSAPAADFFRPNFFVNTPDINPWFLQQGGRPGFLIRAVLAATLSGLWGVYSGFEVCEAAGLPGKEEYLDSEKYELRRRDRSQAGNIVAEITRLNRLRRDNPALQSHLGLRFHDIDNAQILFYTKSTPDADNIVIVAVSLDPRAWQSGTMRLPLWQWGLPDDGEARLHDVFEDRQFTARGQYRRIDLSPERPFIIWRLLPS